MAESFPDLLPADELLRDVLDVSLTGLVYYLPVFDPAAPGQVLDFAFAYLNPAAQRMLRLPAQPAGTHLDFFPESRRNGSLAFHRDAYASGEPGFFETNYQADGYDNYFRVSARRSGPGLLVSFTDTADQPRSPVEVALREAQARERAAHAEAEAQRQLLHNVLYQAPTAMALLDGPTYRIALANPTVCELWGKPEAQLLGVPLLEALPELQGQGVDTLLDGVLRTGEPFFGTELPFQLARHGRLETIYFNFVYQPQRNAAGDTTGVLVVATDVTEIVTARQKVEAQERTTAELNEELAAANEEIRANNDELMRSQLDLLDLNQELEARVQQRTEALEAQQTELQEVFEQVPAAIAIFEGPDQLVKLANSAQLDLWGQTAAEVLGKPLAEALPEARASGYAARLTKVLNSGASLVVQDLPATRTRHGQRVPGYFDVVYQPQRNAQGQVRGVIVVTSETTQQVAARQQLEQREASFRTMADAAPAMLWVTDPAGQCTYLNAQWYQFTGQTEAEALGLGWTHAVHPDDAEMAGQTFLDANARRVPFHCLYRLRRHDGVYRWATDTGLPHFGGDGEYVGIVGTVIDVHEQQLAQDGLQATNAQLTRTNADLDNFIYTASHDLKAPISNIEGLLYLLQQELPADVKAGEYVAPTLAKMLDSVERFKRTIEQLTEVSKLQQAHSPDATAVSLAVVIEAVRLDLAPVLRDANARLLVDVAELPPILFSEKNLRSIVYNLLSNALKYRHPDRRPHVDVRAHVRPGHTVLEVHDNGLGIAQHQLPKLFGMFQRFHDHVEGTGIGLYMVKRMVENAGGRVEVHSQLGAGTTFFVHLLQPDGALAGPAVP
ncbi:MAG TPA: PAS domain S-box protein [Hymenobacter sp.]|uniref:PAS domain S-box protein n=1 Tax=Hymenobacter sp. TaxID=1898978 RepID=UPI002ED8C701